MPCAVGICTSQHIRLCTRYVLIVWSISPAARGLTDWVCTTMITKSTIPSTAPTRISRPHTFTPVVITQTCSPFSMILPVIIYTTVPPNHYISPTNSSPHVKRHNRVADPRWEAACLRRDPYPPTPYPTHLPTKHSARPLRRLRNMPQARCKPRSRIMRSICRPRC